MKKILLGLLVVKSVIGAEYIVPAEYDNNILATESTERVLISNTLGTLSTASRTIGGKTVRFRCTIIPKIDCRGTAPRIILTTSEFSLREPVYNKLVNIYTYDVFEEDGGTDWRVCGGAVGGTTWDDSKLSSTVNEAGETVITHTYVPNAEQEIFHFFTNDPNNGSNTSFMVVETKQVCI